MAKLTPTRLPTASTHAKLRPLHRLERTVTRNLHQLDQQHVIHPYTNLAAHRESGPLMLCRGEGVYVFDDEDNRFIEGMAGLWCASLGYSETRLAEAAARQFATLPFSHLFAHRATPPAIELAAALADMTPPGLNRVFTVNSGSEAVDAAIKMVWFYNNALNRPDKKTFLARNRAYHGVTVAAGSLTGLPYVHNGFDLPRGTMVHHLSTPHHYRYAEPGESEEAFTDRLVEELRATIEREGAETIAAFIAEPVMGAGGVLIPPVGYFEKMQAVLRENDILCISDEVINGFGRTGELFGCSRFGFQPDIITCAKQLSSAYIPIGAVVAADHVYNALEEYSGALGMFGTGNTYGGHPVASAVALETLKIYAERDIVGMVRAREPQFLARLAALSEHPLVGDARGVGLIGAVELVKDKATREQYPPEQKVAAQVAAACVNHGLILRPTPGDAVAMCPPLIISESELDALFDALTAALDDVAARL